LTKTNPTQFSKYINLTREETKVPAGKKKNKTEKKIEPAYENKLKAHIFRQPKMIEKQPNLKK